MISSRSGCAAILPVGHVVQGSQGSSISPVIAAGLSENAFQGLAEGTFRGAAESTSLGILQGESRPASTSDTTLVARSATLASD